MIPWRKNNQHCGESDVLRVGNKARIDQPTCIVRSKLASTDTIRFRKCRQDKEAATRRSQDSSTPHWNENRGMRARKEDVVLSFHLQGICVADELPMGQ